MRGERQRNDDKNDQGLGDQGLFHLHLDNIQLFRRLPPATVRLATTPG
jgi:hypothetical protein